MTLDPTLSSADVCKVPASRAPAWVRRHRLTYALWRLGVAIVGGVVTLLGCIMTFLPLPGSVVALAGLAILATEFDWARRALGCARRRARAAARRVIPVCARRRRVMAATAALTVLGLCVGYVKWSGAGLPV